MLRPPLQQCRAGILRMGLLLRRLVGLDIAEPVFVADAGCGCLGPGGVAGHPLHLPTEASAKRAPGLAALAPFSNSSREMKPAMILLNFFWMLRQSVTMTPGVAEQSTWQTAASSALPMV